jgi:hypothetical protein
MVLLFCIHVDSHWPHRWVGVVGCGQLKVTLAGLLLGHSQHSLSRRSHQEPSRSYWHPGGREREGEREREREKREREKR